MVTTDVIVKINTKISFWTRANKRNILEFDKIRHLDFRNEISIHHFYCDIALYDILDKN